MGSFKYSIMNPHASFTTLQKVSVFVIKYPCLICLHVHFTLSFSFSDSIWIQRNAQYEIYNFDKWEHRIHIVNKDVIFSSVQIFSYVPCWSINIDSRDNHDFFHYKLVFSVLEFHTYSLICIYYYVCRFLGSP